MKFDNYLENCKDNDILCYEEKLFKLGNFKQAIVNAFKTAIPDKLHEELASQDIHIRLINTSRYSRNGYQTNNKAWFDEGVDFQILKAGSEGWQKGKLKVNVTLKFIPDEPEEIKSPLDDVRQEIDNEKC